jgi:uncharacterized protein (DUF488 family)
MRIFTIGHSTRTADELVRLLRESAVKRLADIRRFPGSRRHPHFSREALSRSLPEAGIEYVHVPELGGRRDAVRDSPHTALRSDQFRGYADHMLTAEFRDALDALLASPLTTAVMCAEAQPSNCHRQFVADELLRRGLDVIHILGYGRRERHTMNPLAVVEGDRLVYREAQGTLLG